MDYRRAGLNAPIFIIVVILVIIVAAGSFLAFSGSPNGNSSSSVASSSQVVSQSTTVTSSSTLASSTKPTDSSVIKVFSVQGYSAATSPNNDVIVSVPSGWVSSFSNDETTLTITPQGQSAPVIFVYANLVVSDISYAQGLNSCAQQYQGAIGAQGWIQCVLTNAIGRQVSDASHGWSPGDALQALLQYSQTGDLTYGTPQITSVSSSVAWYSVSASKNGQSLEDWGYISMAYAPNPLLTQPSGQPGNTSVAYLFSCSSPTDQVQSFRATCSRVLNSFRASQTWHNSLAQQLILRYQKEAQFFQSEADIYAQESQIISKFASATQQMQTQLFKNIQQSDDYVNQQWWASLGGQTNVQDPKTGGVYMVPSGYSTYCDAGSGNILAGGVDIAPGKSFDTSSGSLTCDHFMGSWSPP